MMKRIVAVLLASVMTASLIGCGGTAAETPAAAPAAAEEPAAEEPAAEEPAAEAPAADASGDELTIAIWDSNQEPGLTQIVNDFTAKTGIPAKIQVTPWTEYWTMLEAGATGGSLPDVFWMHSNEFSKYAEYDMLLDISDKISSSSVLEMNEFPSDIVELYNYDGKQLAVPKDFDTIGLWYNKTMFDEAGVSYPDADWTWDDFADACKKVTDPSKNQYGCCIKPSNNQEGWYNTVFDMGGCIVNEDRTASGMDSDGTVKAVTFISDLAKNGYMPPYEVLAENEANALLEAGTVAMVLQGSWMLADLCNNDYVKANCDVAVLPKDAETGRRVSIYNGLGWAISGNTSKADAAWQLVEYLGSREAQQKQSDLGIVISAMKGTEKNWIKAYPDFNLQAYLDMTEDMVIRPYTKHTTVWEDKNTETLVDAWTGKRSAEDVCKELAEFMNNAIAEE